MDPAILLLAAATASATPIVGWTDTSGHNRDATAAETDAELCMNKIGTIQFGGEATVANALAAFQDALNKCMADRGWQPKSN